VFGNEVGEPITSVRIAWETARATAGLPDLHRDLRHEAGSRFDEAGVSTNYVSKILGHANLSTTTRYLNIQRRGLHLAMEKLEANQALAAEPEDESRSREAEECGIRCTQPTIPRQPLCPTYTPSPPISSCLLSV